ncbi:hypothetical protein [Paracoccus nototheniae]|uniref:Uncharacterized protein n=1 Tax=Paracoccus nototheniae TaxID=2489002 RepID=A0ABW4DZW6_9RHOB|nr:hypothetical protein [Paracoccus nototheniae]
MGRRVRSDRQPDRSQLPAPPSGRGLFDVRQPRAIGEIADLPRPVGGFHTSIVCDRKAGCAIWGRSTGRPRKPIRLSEQIVTPSPAALTLVNPAPRFASYRLGVALAGIVGALSVPGQIRHTLFVFPDYSGTFPSATGADHGRRLRYPSPPRDRARIVRPRLQHRYLHGLNVEGRAASRHG